MNRQDVKRRMLDEGEAGPFDEELLGQGLQILARMIARHHIQKRAQLELESQMTSQEILEKSYSISTLP